MKNKKLVFGIAVCAAIALIVLVIYRHHQSAPVQVEAHGPATAQVAEVQRGNISEVLTLAGQFQPYQVVEVHPKVSGFIRKINVDIGDIVHRGQTLAVLEVPELQAQLQGTVSSLSQAKAQVVQAQNEVSRAESQHVALHEDNLRLQEAAKAQPGLIAEQELDDAQAKDLASQAQVAAAKSALAAAQQAEQVARANHLRVSALNHYTDVVAPLNGVITWRYADTGALIQAGTTSDTQALPIVKLSQSDLLRLRVPVPEDDVRYVNVGDPMQVYVGAIGRSFEGKVVRFTRSVSLDTRTMETEIDVPNPDLTIDPGMYANTELQLAHVNNVPTVALDALVHNNGNGWEAYVVDSTSHVQIRPVKVGVQGSNLAQIVSGLQPGDRVILGGQGKYQQGELVKPILQKEPASEVYKQTGGMIDMSASQESD
ncbi:MULTISPECIES: efflux RND transporter periplasmic adaptor subunit [Acidobacterium]|uniref:Efflux transporter, RND family, MFP subunit n=1 Tax=Acidobacterium capsulatum (strain ATCC 51196 / DSM 11244 / BCRC 80197 / JCM 7670 / NBRC 15755 / NCIMB 13165 / 161) TaxID=240015 RepID=C1F5Z9_ACIC5|nr:MULTISPECIES: efflux RND transporter periplasmic adaptor subunit [Acidobacterium]ACO32593.1 efflux transporter, RND family, MFP subunit [Acidobacterium capsulatum ATCC 51196]HCT60423.1 efflux RND transporter periplasmic adaptor subunit [Acidobacterium sp.]